MLLEAPDNFGLPLVAPAGVAADRADVLRNAFMAMAADPAYQSDARKAEQPVGEPIAGRGCRPWLTNWPKTLRRISSPRIESWKRQNDRPLAG